MKEFQREYEFVLPKGYMDKDGNLQREGIMRLATAADEILPLKDPRVQSNPSYLAVILLSRVVVTLGSLEAINPKVIEDMFAEDFAYLQDFYSRINFSGKRSKNVVCPKCEHGFEVEPEEQGE